MNYFWFIICPIIVFINCLKGLNYYPERSSIAYAILRRIHRYTTWHVPSSEAIQCSAWKIWLRKAATPPQLRLNWTGAPRRRRRIKASYLHRSADYKEIPAGGNLCCGVGGTQTKLLSWGMTKTRKPRGLRNYDEIILLH